MSVKFKDIANVKKLIAMKGFTLSSFSEHIGMERSFLYVTLKRNAISAPSAKKICEALEVNFDDIFLLKVSTKVAVKVIEDKAV